MNTQMQRTGGELVVRALEAQGVTRMSCVPGESYLAVLDALIESEIELDVARHEAGAGNMAIAHGKLTGRAGVVAVTRGPGAMHAAIAVHTAEQDALPLVVLIGQVALRDRGRGGFQEMEYGRVFGSVAKWVTSLDTVDRIPETIARAFRIAEGGRPGPVIIEMPEDILVETSRVETVARRVPATSAPAPQDILRVGSALERAKKPIVLLGRAAWSEAAAMLAQQFGERYSVPMLAGFRCQDYIDNDSAEYAGHVGLSTDETLVRRLEEADLLIAVGGHIGDAETRGYEVLAPRVDRTVVHVAACEGDLDRYLGADQALVATPELFFQAMLEQQVDTVAKTAWAQQLRSEEELRQVPPEQEGDVLSEVMRYLQSAVGENTIVANGAGNYAIWVHQFHRYRRYGSQLAPASGAMGFGLPAGIAAGLARPEAEIIVFAGDGCVSMALPELSTLAASGAKVTVIVVNNSSYGTIRLHQERRYPGRVSGTALRNPDFAGVARAHGLYAERVSTVGDFAAVWESEERQSRATVIELVVSSARSTPRALIEQVQAQ